MTAAASTSLTTGGQVATVPVQSRVSVIYKFNFSASNQAGKLKLPYAVAVDGQALPEYRDKAKALTNSEIKLSVIPGSLVELYLNSDAHPQFRLSPVYALRVPNRDALVTIKELRGRGSGATAVTGAARTVSGSSGAQISAYDALLTGDIWMQISHRYTADEAAAMLPADTDPGVRAAILLIYRPLTQRILRVLFPATAEMAEHILYIGFAESENARQNITVLNDLADVLTRTHPHAYLAAFSNARSVGLRCLIITSNWRPMLGSIVHRAGLGLDVSRLRSPDEWLLLNRKVLSSGSASSGTNVSQEEKHRYDKYREKSNAVAIAEDELRRLQRLLNMAETAAQKGTVNAQITEQQQRVQDSRNEQATAGSAWKNSLAQNEPALIRKYRAAVQAHGFVSQVMDPWYMDLNTRDNVAAEANQQFSANEKLHADHLHITITEAKLL